MPKLGQDYTTTWSLSHTKKVTKVGKLKDPPCEFRREEKKPLTNHPGVLLELCLQSANYPGILCDGCPQSARSTDHPLVDVCQQSANVVKTADEHYRAPLVARKDTNEEKEYDICHITEQLLFLGDQIPVIIQHRYGVCRHDRIGNIASIDTAETVSPSPPGSASSSLLQSVSISSSPTQATLHPFEQIKSVTVRVGDVPTTESVNLSSASPRASDQEMKRCHFWGFCIVVPHWQSSEHYEKQVHTQQQVAEGLCCLKAGPEDVHDKVILHPLDLYRGLGHGDDLREHIDKVSLPVDPKHFNRAGLLLLIHKVTYPIVYYERDATNGEIWPSTYQVTPVEKYVEHDTALLSFSTYLVSSGAAVPGKSRSVSDENLLPHHTPEHYGPGQQAPHLLQQCEEREQPQHQEDGPLQGSCQQTELSRTGSSRLLTKKASLGSLNSVSVSLTLLVWLGTSPPPATGFVPTPTDAPGTVSGSILVLVAASPRVSAVSTASGSEPSPTSSTMVDSPTTSISPTDTSTMENNPTTTVFPAYACIMVERPTNTQSTVWCLTIEGSRFASVHSKDRISTHYEKRTGKGVPGHAPLQPVDKLGHLHEDSNAPQLLHGHNRGQDHQVPAHPCQQEGHDGGQLTPLHDGDHPHAQDLYSQLELGIHEYSCIQFKASLAYLKLETAVIFLDSLHLQQSLNQQHGVAPRAVCNPWVYRGHHHQLQVVQTGHCLGRREIYDACEVCQLHIFDFKAKTIEVAGLMQKSTV